MGCGSSVVQTVPSTVATPAPASAPAASRWRGSQSAKPSTFSSTLIEKKSDKSKAPVLRLSSTAFRRTSEDKDDVDGTASRVKDARGGVRGSSAAGSSEKLVAGAGAGVLQPRTSNALGVLDADALRDDIPMMESLSGDMDFTSTSSSSSFVDGFNTPPGDPRRESVPMVLHSLDTVMVPHASTQPHDSSSSAMASDRMESGRTSVSLLSDSDMNRSFGVHQHLDESQLSESSARPASGLATFADDAKHVCNVCGQTAVTYVCEQCESYWCEECRFKHVVFESHPPDHTINALHDGQHCNASRTFAESFFYSTDNVISSMYGAGSNGAAGGGASTLLYNPCTVCAHAINDTDVVYRCGHCDFIACAACFVDGRATHAHPLQRFQRRAKHSVQEKPLMLKKKTSDGNRIINDYVIVRLLGRGGNAKVKLVQHTKTRQFYALKILKRPKVSVTNSSINAGSGLAVGGEGLSSNSSSGGVSSAHRSVPPQPQPHGTSTHGSLTGVRGATSSTNATGNGVGGQLGNSVATSGSARGGCQPSLDDMLREIAVMKFIDHPNIVQLKEVIEDTEAQRAYIIMEYCEKGAIYTHGDPPLPMSTVRQYAADILHGLQHLHSQYLYHRDIKPANCLVDSHGTVKITDFGTTNSSITSGHTGTLAYCCPEERQGEPYTGDVKDSWAFAMTLYEIAYGRLPFAQLDYLSVRQALASRASFDFPRDADVDPTLIDLLEHMLCKDLATRMLISNASAHPFFIDSRECSLSVSSTPIAPGRQQLQRGSLIHHHSGVGGCAGNDRVQCAVAKKISAGEASRSSSVGGASGDDCIDDDEAAQRHKELYERATASVIRGRNLLDAFHGSKSIQQIRQREQNHAQSSVASKMAVAASMAAATANKPTVLSFASPANSGARDVRVPAHHQADLLRNGRGLLDREESLLLGGDDNNSNCDDADMDADGAPHWEIDGSLQVDCSLPSLMSRSQSMPVGSAQRNGNGGRATASAASVRQRLTFETSMTPDQQQVVRDKIEQYMAAPKKMRHVLRVTDVLMLSPPTALVESVAGTVVSLQFARTALTNLGSIDLSSFNALKDITLCGNRLTEIPEAVLDAPRLLRLDLSNNRIRHVPSSLRHARFLQRLNLHGNNISEVGMDGDGHSYFSSTCLRHVRLSSNPMYALPKALDTTTKLELVLDAMPALTEEWERVVAQCRPNPPPAVITWDDSFPQKLAVLPVAVWVATAALPVYRSHILKACSVRHVVLPCSADARFPTGLHQSHTLEAYFKRLLHAVFGLQRAEIVAGSPESNHLQPHTTSAAATTTDTEAASRELTAQAMAVVAENWAPLPSVVGKAARAYVASYFFISEAVEGGVPNATGEAGLGNGTEGGFEDLRVHMAAWLRAGESFLCFVPQAKRDMHEELTVTLGLALEDAFGEEWGEARFDRWLDTYGIL